MVHLVAEQIAGLACAVRIVTAPVPEVAFVELNLGCRAQPLGPVELFDDLLGVGSFPVAVIAVPAPWGLLLGAVEEPAGVDDRDGADATFLDQAAGLGGGRELAALVAELEDGVFFLHGRAHAFGGGDGDRQAFFAVDRLACGDGVEDHLFVPVIGCCDHDRLDLRVGQQVVIVFVLFGLRIAAGFEATRQVRAVDIAEGDDLGLGNRAGVFDEIPAACAETDVAETNRLLGQVGSA